MSIQSICRYISILTISMVLVSVAYPVLAQTDTAATDTIRVVKVKKVDSAGHQLCLGVDIVHPVENFYYNDRYSYEFQADYYLHNEFYAAMELGWGGSNVNYPDLKYTTTNQFIRLGFNKTILPRDRPNDWDMMLFGLRMAASRIDRSNTSFTVLDSVWGNTPEQYLPQNKPFIAVWTELTMGMRVAIINNLNAGWNIRGKIMLNGKSFDNPSPLYIAGYGRGDKNTAFDFNLYISYAFRWKRKSLTAAPATPGKNDKTQTEFKPKAG